MKKEYAGSVTTGRFIIFPNTKNWRFGFYNIGTTKILMIGPTRIFVHTKS